MEKIINYENDWDHRVDRDAVEESPIDYVSRNEAVQTLNEIQTEKASGLSNVTLEVIADSREIGIQDMVELCQKLLDKLGMPVDRYHKYSYPNFQEKRHHELQLQQRCEASRAWNEGGGKSARKKALRNNDY